MKFDIAKIKTGLSTKAGRAKLTLDKHSPEILLGVGILTFVGTVVLACRGTLKAKEVLEQHEENMKDIHDAAEVDSEYALSDDIKADKMKAYCKVSIGLAKEYAPAVALGAVSIACLLTSRNILNKRYLAAVSAYNGLSEVFRAYRKRVVDEYGKELDQHFRYGTTYDTLKVTESGEDGKVTEKELDVSNTDKSKMVPSDESVFFDESNPNWDPNPAFSMMFLKAQQAMATNILQSVGHIFLNEVYGMLGFPHTQNGAIVGWVKGLGDDYVDFGLYDQANETTRRFVNGMENIILLQFNHDGIIWDKI